MGSPRDEWSGQFGNEYTKRSPGNLEANIALFARALCGASGIGSVLELGAGSGNNLMALNRLLPGLFSVALEVNPKALEILRKLAAKRAIAGLISKSAQEWTAHDRFDLVLTKGFLIHVPPLDLPALYRKMISASKRYILVCEYYNPTPTEVEYRGRQGMLWKRDFAGELMACSRENMWMDAAGQLYPVNLKLVDYGFVYRADPMWPQDDITYFLLERGVA